MHTAANHVKLYNAYINNLKVIDLWGNFVSKLYSAEANLEPCQTSKMDLFAKIDNDGNQKASS